jgi:pimeloyl-ACP methyl ester carboxylesterase
MESGIVFGDLKHLSGVYCSAEAGTKRDFSVIMLNPGMLNRTGPMRLHVQLARRLAAAGISSLRFDLSGIGESLGIGVSGSSLERAAREIRWAIDWLHSQQGIRRCVLLGICSGADDSLAAATTDPRVIGCCMLDGCGYPTARHYLHWGLRKVQRWTAATKWQELWDQCRGQASQPASMPMGTDIREYPGRDESEAALLTLVERGVRFQFLYTGGVVDYYSYPNQFHDMFPRLAGHPSIEVHYRPAWDHLISLQVDRSELFDLISRWLEKIPTATANGGLPTASPMPATSKCGSSAVG